VLEGSSCYCGALVGGKGRVGKREREFLFGLERVADGLGSILDEAVVR
jgi:hypothetical protein